VIDFHVEPPAERQAGHALGYRATETRFRPSNIDGPVTTRGRRLFCCYDQIAWGLSLPAGAATVNDSAKAVADGIAAAQGPQGLGGCLR